MRARVRAGDPDAFSRLFDDHARSVYNHAFRLTGDWSAAEDVVSLTFLEAWRLRGRIDMDGGSLRPWLLGVATNVTRNTRRSARRHADALARLPPGEAIPDIAEEVAARVDDDELLASVRVALGALRRSEREVLALCVWAGLGYAEAAEALGVPMGTIRSRLSRARKRLRKLAASTGADARTGAGAGASTDAGAGARTTADAGASTGADAGAGEPRARSRQVNGDRENAVRFVREKAL